VKVDTSRRIRHLPTRRAVLGWLLVMTSAPLVWCTSPTTVFGATPTYRQVPERVTPFSSSAPLPAGYGSGSGFCPSISGTNKTAPVSGTNLGASYGNVYACGPALGTWWSNDLIEGDFQCVELSARFMWDVYGLRVSVSSGATFVSTIHNQFPAIPVQHPGVGQVPAPGDIVSLSGGPKADPDGHTAVVTSVNVNPLGNGTVTVMEQNGLSTGWDHINVSNWVETFGNPSYLNGYYYYPNVSWLVLNTNHAPGNANAPAATADSSGHQFVVWKGTDANLWQAYWDGTVWTGPSLVGMGPLGSLPTITQRPSTGEVDVFWKGTDANLWEAVHTASGWLGPFNRHMGPLGSQPAATASGNQTDVFWKGTDANLWTGSSTGSVWSGPRSLGMGPLGSKPSAVSISAVNEDVFWSGTDNFLWEAKWDGSSWSGPLSQGLGPLGTPPAADALSTGIVNVSWEGWDGTLWLLTSSATGWTPLNIGMGPLGSSPAATAWGTEVDVFWRGIDDNIWTAKQPTATVWNGPTPVGMGPLG